MAEDIGAASSPGQLQAQNPARLMAIVEVDKAERVYCAQPGCHHTVYKAIHVVKERGQLLVLGSTCFQKRYGSLNALGKAQYWGGNGKVLTPEERALLAENTQVLLARFEDEEARLRKEAELKLQKLREASFRPLPHISSPFSSAMPRATGHGMAPRPAFPWSWMMPGTSVAAFKLHDGSGWVRVQHRDRRQFIVPWPNFEGWEEALTPLVGKANSDVCGYEVIGPVAGVIAYLRAHAAAEKVTGLWREVTTLLGAKS